MDSIKSKQSFLSLFIRTPFIISKNTRLTLCFYPLKRCLTLLLSFFVRNAQNLKISKEVRNKIVQSN